MAITLDTSQGAGNSADPSSSVTGGTQINIVPRLTVSEGGSAVWMNPCISATGVNGLTPTFVCPLANAISNGAPGGSAETGFFSYNGLDWFACGNAPVYSGGNITWQHNAAFNQNTVTFARDRRECTSQIASFVGSLVSNFPGQVTGFGGLGSTTTVSTYSTQTDELGRTVAATNLYGFMLWGAAFDMPRPRRIGLISGVHGGEDLGTSIYRALINWLLAGSSQAVALLANYDFVCLPLLNAPGRDGGHSRAQFQVTASTHNDLNRHFEDVTNLFETITLPRTCLNAQLTNNQVAAFLDFHTYANSSDPAMTYFTSNANGVPTSNTGFDTYIVNRMSTCGGSGNGGVEFQTSGDNLYTTSWCWNNKTSPVSMTLEWNMSFSKTDADIVNRGAAVGLALFDAMQAGLLGQAGATGTFFSRHA